MKILSGVFEDERTDGQVTTGTPISLMIENVDQRSKDYSEIRDNSGPGHADYTYHAEVRRARLSRRRALLGARDGRAGRGRRGRAQGHSGRRASAARWCRSARTRSTRQLGLGRGRPATRSGAPDAKAAALWESYLDGVRKAGSSLRRRRRGRGRGRAGRLGRADLWQARRRIWPRR